MLNLYGQQGMGAAGTGVNPAGNMTMQQIMAMMQAQGGAAPSPLSPGNGPTPMANYIGAPGGGAMQQRPQMPAVAGNPAPNDMGQSSGGPGAGIMQQLQMLQNMKQGQNGVAPSGGTPIPGAPNTGGAASMLPAWLQALLHSGSYGATGMGMAPAVGSNGMMGGGV